jgi:hypothetical protein
MAHFKKDRGIRPCEGFHLSWRRRHTGLQFWLPSPAAWCLASIYIFYCVGFCWTCFHLPSPSQIAALIAAAAPPGPPPPAGGGGGGGGGGGVGAAGGGGGGGGSPPTARLELRGPTATRSPPLPPAHAARCCSGSGSDGGANISCTYIDRPSGASPGDIHVPSTTHSHSPTSTTHKTR